MKRFLKVSVLLLVSLFLLVSGVDAGLDQLSRSQTQSSFTIYNEKGQVIVAYTSDLNHLKTYAKRGFFSEYHIIHRS